MNLEQAYKILEENKQTYNEIADEFDQTRNKYDFLIDELKKHVRKNEKVLDLGCGNGRLYKIFENKNVNYTGIDFSENLIQKDIEKYGNHFKTADILSLPFSEEKFDSVWAIAVLHHIPTEG
jgi:ubiquinone/menaquinone biosynthesis C-methylase UbiE